MNRDIQQQAEQLNKSHLLRQRWHRWFSVPACIVVFITAYALILPAITLDTAPDAYCGQEEHIHTDACYEMPGVSEHIVIDCPVQNELHTHTSECYDDDGLLACGYEVPQIIHHHDSFCFDSGGELICTLPEVNAEDAPNGMVHQHTADCQVAIPAVAPESLICTKTEHIHTAECLDPEKWGLMPDGSTSEEEEGTDKSEEEFTNESDSNGLYDIEQDTELIPLLEMTGAQLASLTDEEIEARTEEFLSLTDEEFDSLNERMATAADEPMIVLHRQRLLAAPMAAELQAEIHAANVELNGVSVSIEDRVSENGCFEVSYSGGDLSGSVVTFKWYRTDDNSSEAPVARKFYRVGGVVTSNLSGNEFENLNLALDGGGITNSRSSVTYRAVLYVDGVETGIEATLSNTTHQSEVLNGSFETPSAVSWGSYEPHVTSGTNGIVWKTSASDNDIELVSVATNTYRNLAEQWHGITTVPDGSQCAELNAEQAGALYQQVITTPGLTMSWRLDHMARTRSGDNRYDGTDAMYIVIMDTEKARALAGNTDEILKVAKAIAAGQTTVDGVDYSGAYSKLCESVSKWTRSGWGWNQTYTNSCTWQTHSGTYTVPAGQYRTTYFFVAASTASGNATIGNHIDNVWFSTEAPPAAPNDAKLTLTKTVYGDLSETQLHDLLMNLSFRLIRTSDGSVLKTIYAYELGDWNQLGDGAWQLSKTLSITDLLNERIRVEEADYELEGFDVNAVQSAAEFTVGNQQSYGASFENTYTVPTRTLTVTKYVNAADTTGLFDITVSYTSDRGANFTQTYPLDHGGSCTVSGIPDGARVTVNEPSHDGYTVRMTDDGGLDVSNSDIYTFTITGNTGIHIYNTAGVPLPETGGISPYIFIYGGLFLMLSSVMTGYLLRRRRGKEGA